MSKAYGKNGVEAEVVAHSISPEGKEIITFNIKYGLIVHAEFLRHRLFSNSVKSNRAIPMKKLRKEVLKEPYVPVYFGAAQKGMVADKEVSSKKVALFLWRAARYPACFFHWVAEKLGAHKEWANRLLNPWQFVRETVTATEWDNFYNLRLHKDAQKDIQEIAKVMAEAKKYSKPMLIEGGEWHTPYVDRLRRKGELLYVDNDGSILGAEEAIKASVARCARSSYDNHDSSQALYEKDEPLYHTLIISKPTHGSPAEHVATPMEIPSATLIGGVIFPEDGQTHVDKDDDYWSGNLKGWIQHRQLLDDHVCWDFKENKQ